MPAPRFDSRRLDVEALAKDGATHEGTWPAGELARLMDSVHVDCETGKLDPVSWQVKGEYRKPRATEPQVWLHLNSSARLPLVCQRCLGVVDTAVHVETAIGFVRGEEAAAQLDAEGDVDVLALTRWLDLQTLAEDELLLALPLVPRHERCPPGGTGVAPQEQRVESDPAPHPFAALAALKGSPPSRP